MINIVMVNMSVTNPSVRTAYLHFLHLRMFQTTVLNVRLSLAGPCGCAESTVRSH